VNGETSAEPYISIIVPVFDERESLRLLHEKISAVTMQLGHCYEVIYVDDGSTDGSTDVLTNLQNEDPLVRVAVQRRNFGKSLALNVGFALARGDILITMDADLQDEPEEIPRMLEKLAEGYDVVSGWKKIRHDPLSKRIPSKIANWFTRRLTGIHMHDMNSGFKLYRLDCVKQLELYGDLHRYIPALAYYAGFRVTEIPVTHHKRQFGKSKYGAGRLVRGGLDLLTVVFLNRYGRRPLHLFGGAGAILLMIGLFINVWLSIDWLMGPETPLSERPLLILGVLLMVMGVQLLTMGLVAELIVAHIQRTGDPLNTVKTVYQTSEPQYEDVVPHS